MAVRGYTRFTVDIDLLTTDARVLNAATWAVLGVTIAVPTTSDLILLKLAAGGHLDLHDAAALIALANRARLIADVEARLGDA
jgi:hypothetical protein